MYKLSNLAADDFSTIYEYSWRQFGPLQADKYTNELDLFLRLLAKNPLMGRDIHIIEGVRRHDHGQHAIFYQMQNDGIFVVRILHQQMNPLIHLQGVFHSSSFPPSS